MIDGDSGESTVANEVADVGRDESESEWLVRGCRRVAVSTLNRLKLNCKLYLASMKTASRSTLCTKNLSLKLYYHHSTQPVVHKALLHQIPKRN